MSSHPLSSAKYHFIKTEGQAVGCCSGRLDAALNYASEGRGSASGMLGSTTLRRQVRVWVAGCSLDVCLAPVAHDLFI